MEKNIIAFSGGKDSTAMLLRMLEKKEQIDHIVFADTGFEFPELYEYIKRIEKLINRKITIVKPKTHFNEWMTGLVTRGENKGKVRGFPLRLYPCYWMREAKWKPIEELEKQFPDHNICIGIAADEQNRVQKKSNVRYPLIEWGWSEAVCVKYLNSKKVLNPLYTNFDRIGCYHCPKQNLMSLYGVWKNYPKLFERIKGFSQLQRDLKGEHIKFTSKELSIFEIESLFKNGIVPNETPKYECFECKGVNLAYNKKVNLKDFCQL